MNRNQYENSGAAKLMRDPLVLFMICGAVIFAAYEGLKVDAVTPIVLSAELRAKLIDEFEFINGREASDQEIKAIQQDYISDELLFREALESNLHLIDPATRLSLIEIMRFRAVALLPEPTDSDLINFYAQNMQNYYTPNTASFEHIYFLERPTDELSLRAKLQAGETMLGDDFPNALRFTSISDGMIRASFGQDFLSRLHNMDLGQWHAPIASNYGYHFVRLDARELGKPIPFALAKVNIENDFLEYQAEQAIQVKVAKLKDKYEIVIEP